MALANVSVVALDAGRAELWRSGRLAAAPAPPPAAPGFAPAAAPTLTIAMPPAAARARFLRVERHFDETAHAAPQPQASLSMRQVRVFADEPLAWDAADRGTAIARTTTPCCTLPPPTIQRCHQTARAC